MTDNKTDTESIKYWEPEGKRIILILGKCYLEILYLVGELNLGEEGYEICFRIGDAELFSEPVPCFVY